MGLGLAAFLLSLSARGADRFLAPLATTPGLTSGFGEYRDGRFHAGIDYSTEQTTGKPVRAIADGWVWRVRSSGVGYGRSLYFRLADGRTAVFAHLERFAPAIESYVAARQDSSGEYEQDLFPPERKLRFKAGETLAWSGETGAGPPHLHFELRHGDMNLNPLTHGFAVADRTPPTLASVWLVPAGPRSRVDGGFDPRRIGFASGKSSRVAEVRGPFHLMVETWDRVDGRPNRLATYGLSATLDGAPAFEALLDSVAWDHMTESETVFDYAAVLDGSTDRRRLALLPGTRAGIVRRGPPVWSLRPGERTIRIEARDEAGNRSEATLIVRAIEGSEDGVASVNAAGEFLPAAGADPPVRVTARGATVYVGVRASGNDVQWKAGRALVSSDTLRAGNAIVRSFGVDPEHAASDDGWVIAPRGLWHVRLVGATPEPDSIAVGRLRLRFERDAWFEPTALVGTIANGGSPVSGTGELVPFRDRAAVEIGPADAVLRTAARVELGLEGADVVPRDPEAADRRGLGLYVRQGGGSWSLVTTDIDSLGRLTGSTRRLGTFAVLRDTVPPAIVVRYRRDTVIPASVPAIFATLRDRGSGLSARDQKMFVDGRRVPAEYDSDADRLTFRPRTPLSTGVHIVRFEALDRAGNRASTEVPLEVR
ncbi:MAG: hypothetical protein ACREOU_05260 [Candidatus Eiseniibacteriota bacterium]